MGLKILVTDGDYKHTLGAVRHLAKSGYKVDAIGSRFCRCAFSRYLSKIAYPQELFNDENITNFLNFLKESCFKLIC